MGLAVAPQLQAIIQSAADAAAAESLAQFDYFNALAFKQLKDAGVEFRAFPDEVVAALKVAAAEVLDENAAANPDFAKVKESYDAGPGAGPPLWHGDESTGVLAADVVQSPPHYGSAPVDRPGRLHFGR